MPRLLRDILTRGFSAESDMQLVGAIRDGEALVAFCARTSPHVIVLATAETGEGDLEGLFRADPSVKIVMLGSDGRDARLHQLQRRVDLVPEVSFAALRDAILAAVRAPMNASLGGQTL
jgi:chemotaxis response regulator CheB